VKPQRLLADDRAVGADPLGVGAGGKARSRALTLVVRPGSRTVGAERPLLTWLHQCGCGFVAAVEQLLVHLDGKKILERCVSRQVGGHETQQNQPDQPQEKPRPERECHRLRGRITYPIPRTVWINGGSNPSTLRRR